MHGDDFVKFARISVLSENLAGLVEGGTKLGNKSPSTDEKLRLILRLP